MIDDLSIDWIIGASGHIGSFLNHWVIDCVIDLSVIGPMYRSMVSMMSILLIQ